MLNDIKTAREIVTPLKQYPHIRKDAPVSDAVAQLLGYCSTDGRCMYYDEILVVDDRQRLVGRLSIRDILTGFFPSILAPEPAGIFGGKKASFTDLSILFEDSFRRECRRQATHTVGEFMSKAHEPIDAGIHPLHILEIMMKDGVNTLPVNEKEVLLGAVRMTDLFRILATYCTI